MCRPQPIMLKFLPIMPLSIDNNYQHCSKNSPKYYATAYQSFSGLGTHDTTILLKVNVILENFDLLNDM